MSQPECLLPKFSQSQPSRNAPKHLDSYSLFSLPLFTSLRITAADLWSNDIWGKSLLAHDSHKSWRPLLVFTFRLSHAAADGFDAAAFHLPSKNKSKRRFLKLITLTFKVSKRQLDHPAIVLTPSSCVYYTTRRFMAPFMRERATSAPCNCHPQVRS